MKILFSDLIAPAYIDLIAPIALIIIGYVIEKHYVGRISLFSNAIALFVFYYGKELSSLLGWTINIVIIVGLFTGISRIFQFSLPGAFYKLAPIGSAITTGILLLIGLSL